jgi:hypothetical protein
LSSLSSVFNDESWQDSYGDEEHQQHLQHQQQQQEKDVDTAPPLVLLRRRRWYHKIRIPLGCLYVGCVVFGIYVFLVVSLSDPENPQAKAYEWIRGLTTSTFDTPAMKLWHLQQYFAMATIAYSMEMEQWNHYNSSTTSNWLNYAISECYWMSSSPPEEKLFGCNCKTIPTLSMAHFPMSSCYYNVPELAILQFTNMSRL